MRIVKGPCLIDIDPNTFFTSTQILIKPQKHKLTEKGHAFL